MTHIDYEALENYMPYQGKQYIAPAKAGEREEEMEQYKERGRQARAAFQQIAKLIETQFESVEAQKVSSWMNQAQRGTPLFFCYFFLNDAERDEPTFAIRLFEEDGKVGLSTELSFVERYATERSPTMQNQVLNIPLEDPVYYAIRGESLAETLTSKEVNKQVLQEKIKEGAIRKVLVKYDISKINRFKNPNSLVDAVLDGFDYLQPYYNQTQNV